MTSLHGHEVIEFIHSSNPPIKKTELVDAISKRFGDATFHTCSQSDMSVKDIVEFLESRDKLYVEDGLVHIQTSNVCSHVI